MTNCGAILEHDLKKHIDAIINDHIFEVLSLELTPHDKELLNRDKFMGYPVFCNEHLAISRIIVVRNRRIDYQWIE